MDHSQHHIPAGHSEHSMHHHEAVAQFEDTTSSTINGITTAATTQQQHVHHHTMERSDGTAVSTMMHHMSMAFHFGYEETILFSWWQIESILGLIVSMIVIFIMAILYEGLKYYREFLFWKTYNLLEYRPVTGPQRNAEAGQRASPSTTASPVQYVGEVIHKQPPSMFSLNHFFQTFLHILQVTVSFLLMLIFMTFNVWLCMAVVLGAAVGYFLFCWKKSVIVDVTEHCH